MMILEGEEGFGQDLDSLVSQPSVMWRARPITRLISMNKHVSASN